MYQGVRNSFDPVQDVYVRPTALQPWALWYLRRNPPSLLRRSSFSYEGWKHILLRQGFRRYPLRILPWFDSRGFLCRQMNLSLQ